MPDARPRWWIPQDYQRLKGLDRPAFAWELLRRNPRYAADRAAVPLSDAAVVTIGAGEAIRAGNWGLSFPGGPWSRRYRSAPVLAP